MYLFFKVVFILLLLLLFLGKHQKLPIFALTNLDSYGAEFVPTNVDIFFFRGGDHGWEERRVDIGRKQDFCR